MEYGSASWFERQYQSSSDDPWGLDWRPSQRFRYQGMLAQLSRTGDPNQPPSMIVDVGCATGTFTSMLAQLATCSERSVVGVDIAQAAVERARVRHPSIRFERLSLEECSERFAHRADLVTCLEVLYYVPGDQRVEAVRRLVRMLRPGGRLLVSSMIARPPYFSLEELRSLVARELSEIRCGTIHLKPVVQIEKLMLHLAPSLMRALARPAAGPRAAGDARVLPLVEALCRRLLGHRSASHGFVLGRLDPSERTDPAASAQSGRQTPLRN